MKRIWLLATVLFVLSSNAPAQLVDKVVAHVDKDVVLLSEVEVAARRVIEELERRNDGKIPIDMIPPIYQDALQQLIETKLIEAYAERVELAADNTDIDQMISNIAQDEGVEPDDIYAAAAAEGLPREVYRRELGKQITRMKVLHGPIRSRVEVSDAEIQALHEERYAQQKPGLRVRTRHILIPWAPEQTPENRAQILSLATSVREKAIQTGEFGRLAAEYSRAPTARDGGLTTFREGDVAPEIAAAVFELPPGEVSPIVETIHGANIFQILNRFDPAQIAFADVEGNLRAELTERKTAPAFDSWVEELRENRYIQILDDELKRN